MCINRSDVMMRLFLYSVTVLKINNNRKKVTFILYIQLESPLLKYFFFFFGNKSGLNKFTFFFPNNRYKEGIISGNLHNLIAARGITLSGKLALCLIQLLPQELPD